jgi:predicted AlkP superfamily phosphohydrolase/phosphomutase
MTDLLLIALDGATFDLLEPWMEEGRLPLLSRLFKEGSGGVLMSTVPWATPTAFASLATGTNPGQHGVYDFGRLTNPDYTSFIPTNGSDIHGRTLWRLLAAAGISCGVVNMPMTYPAETLSDGFQIAGIPYPGGSPRLCHPPQLLDELRQQGWDLTRNASDDLGGSYGAYYNGLIELVRNRGAATAWLIEKYHPQFLAVHFLETDQVQHRFWQFMEGEPSYEAGGPHTDAILRLYQETEIAVAQILEAAGEDVTVCIMSDHGFGPTRHQVWLNNWLVQQGFLSLKPSFGVGLKKWLYRAGLSPAAIREMAPERLKLAILQFFERQKGRALASELERDSAEVRRKGLMDWLTERLAVDFYDVNWAKTRAFSTGTTSVGYVWLNLAGRDPQGIVQSGSEYEQTRQEIARALKAWEPVGEVLFREDVWQGGKLEQAPEIIVRWARPSTDARYFQTRFSSHHLIKPVPNDYAGHRPEGVFAFYGPGVKGGRQLEADLLDLTPTLLWLLEQPVPTNMNGRILQELFSHQHDPTFVEPQAIEEDESGLSESDEAAIMQSLKNLGYIE